MNVRYAREFREPARLERVLVKTPLGPRVPLGQLAEIAFTPGPAMAGRRRQLTSMDTATRDIGGYVDAAKAAIARGLQLPTDTPCSGPAGSAQG